jgi:3-oxoacyl-[acyl-carrier protein] reductase
MLRDGEFAGRVAVVTGGSTGLGREVAVSLGALGASVAVGYCRSEQDAHEVVETIEATGSHALAVRADVSDPDAIGALATTVQRELGPAELLVASAGITEWVPFDEVERLTAPLWNRILGVNLVGSFLSVQGLTPQLRAQRGSAVLVASTSALSAAGSSIPYAVSKAGVVALARCLARALAPDVRVNAVAPGWMRTPWVDKYLPPEAAAELKPEQTTPVEDAAGAIVSLLANRSVTGSVLVVDRGELVLRGAGSAP